MVLYNICKGTLLRIAFGILSILLLTGGSMADDEYYIYSKYDPSGISDVVGVGGYVEYQGIPDVWGDEIQYVYFLSGYIGYKVRVTTIDGDGDGNIDPRQHPDHYISEFQGPIEPRQFEIVSSKNLVGYTYGSSATEEFHVDSSGVYLGAYPYGINKWDHNWNYMGKIAISPPEQTQTLAYNSGGNVWYAGSSYRKIYELKDSNNDGSFLDETWTHIFTHPSYGGGHHDGMEYVGGYLWISDMTSDVIGKWWYNPTSLSWEELDCFSYTEPGYVEGMGFGPNDHFWVGSGWGSDSYLYELGNEITKGYPIANAGNDIENYPPTIPVEFDGSASHHTDPIKNIVSYEWDFDGDGNTDSTDIMPEYTYPAFYNPDGSIDWDKTTKDYTVTLKVLDNSNPALTNIDTTIVHITAPPWDPIAIANPMLIIPYIGYVGEPVQLDGSLSFDPEELFCLVASHPWCEMGISKYEWDLDNDGNFDDSTIAKPTWTWNTEGIYNIGLIVTDSQPSGPGGTFGDKDISDKSYATVVIKKEEMMDFSIPEIKPVQVVWDSDINGDGKIDLMKGKSTMIRVIMEVKNLFGQSPSEPIDIRMTFGGVDDTISGTISQLSDEYEWKGVEGEEGTYLFYIDFYLDSPPTTIGDLTVTAEVDTIIEELDKDNNYNEIQITVKETKDLNIEYLKIKPRILSFFESPNSEAFKKTVDQSNKFIRATYPIRDTGIQFGTGEFTSITGGPYWFNIEIVPPCGLMVFNLFDMIGLPFKLQDMQRLEKIAIKLGKDKVIGIVDESYFEGTCFGENDNKICVAGVSDPNIKKAVIIVEGYYTAAAHEIGHTYNLKDEYKVDEGTCTIPEGNEGDPAHGFWVEEKAQIENAVGFMGTAPKPKGTLPQDALNRWIDNADYYHLFNALKKGIDPNILLLSGYISKEDTIELSDWHYIENVEIDEIPPGDYSVEFYDKNGDIIDTTKFDVHFFLFMEPFGEFDIDPASFVLAIPYPENTYKVQIKHNEKILTEINPNSKLLHDAVDLIPDHGFIDNPEQRRKALHNKINEVEIKIEEGDIIDAKNKLEFDIKDKLEKWLIDDYQKDTLQYSKDEIIDLVDEVIGRLDSI